MTKELWKGAKQRSVLGAYTKEWSGDPTDEKMGGMWVGRDSTRMGPVKYPSMDDLAHNPGPTPNKYVRNDLKKFGNGQVLARVDDVVGAGTDAVIKKWHGRGGFSGSEQGGKRISASNHPSAGSDRRTNKGGIGGEMRPGSGKLFTAGGSPLGRGRGGQGTDTAAPRAVPRSPYSAAKGGTGGMGGFGQTPKAQSKGRGKYTWR